MMSMKMRVLSLMALLFVSTLAASGQDAMPTKEETVRFLDRKIKEGTGRVGGETFGDEKYRDLAVWMKGDELTITYSADRPGSRTTWTNTFNPKYIEKVSVIGVRGKNALGLVLIQFAKPVVRSVFMLNGKSDEKDTTGAGFLYFAADEGNGEKVKKALLHLRDLAKAEDELFGN
jgi:hypothetical protein